MEGDGNCQVLTTSCQYLFVLKLIIILNFVVHSSHDVSNNIYLFLCINSFGHWQISYFEILITTSM